MFTELTADKHAYYVPVWEKWYKSINTNCVSY